MKEIIQRINNILSIVIIILGSIIIVHTILDSVFYPEIFSTSEIIGHYMAGILAIILGRGIK